MIETLEAYVRFVSRDRVAVRPHGRHQLVQSVGITFNVVVVIVDVIFQVLTTSRTRQRVGKSAPRNVVSICGVLSLVFSARKTFQIETNSFLGIGISQQ